MTTVEENTVDPVQHLLEIAEQERAYLLVGGGDHCREETIKALVDPRQAEME